MRRITSLLVSAALATTVTSALGMSAPSSQSDKVSYTIGYDLGKNFKAQKVDVNQQYLAQGLADGVSGGQALLTDDQMHSTMMDFQKAMMKKAMAKQAATATKNQAASDAYLAKIAKEPGVKQIENGLYYKIVKAGNGPMPTKNDKVTVNYEGSLADGTVFDSSYKRGKPATFGVSQVIPGWTKALQMMPQGSTWMLYIAPDLAYGKFAPPNIGPNQALTFKVELLKVVPNDAKAQ